MYIIIIIIIRFHELKMEPDVSVLSRDEISCTADYLATV